MFFPKKDSPSPMCLELAWALLVIVLLVLPQGLVEEVMEQPLPSWVLHGWGRSRWRLASPPASLSMEAQEEQRTSAPLLYQPREWMKHNP